MPLLGLKLDRLLGCWRGVLRAADEQRWPTAQRELPQCGFQSRTWFDQLKLPTKNPLVRGGFSQHQLEIVY